jgi:hypothetical protein
MTSWYRLPSAPDTRSSTCATSSAVHVRLQFGGERCPPPSLQIGLLLT